MGDSKTLWPPHVLLFKILSSLPVPLNLKTETRRNSQIAPSRFRMLSKAPHTHFQNERRAKHVFFSKAFHSLALNPSLSYTRNRNIQVRLFLYALGPQSLHSDLNSVNFAQESWPIHILPAFASFQLHTSRTLFAEFLDTHLEFWRTHLLHCSGCATSLLLILKRA